MLTAGCLCMSYLACPVLCVVNCTHALSNLAAWFAGARFASGLIHVIAACDENALLFFSTRSFRGSNSYGQVGDGTTNAKSSPSAALGLSSGVVQLALGNSFTCALRSTGAVLCFGMNSNGQVAMCSAWS